MSRLAEHAAALLGSRALSGVPVHRGDLSEILRVALSDGREVIAKAGSAPRVEAEMLRAIRDSGAPAPAVLAVDSGILVLELLADDGQLHRGWADLGHAVGRLHAARGDAYGWPENFSFGAVPIDNAPAASWPEFWATRRLLPHLPHIPRALAKRIETLAKDLPNRLPDRPPAALLHGDLWSGNVLIHHGRVSGLIDPACSYGDAEVDLAMLQLFARPGPEFFAAYGSLEPGHEARQALYSLWPALVHLRLFGSGYAGMVERFLDAAGVRGC